MKKSVRTVLFYFLFLIFLTSTPLMIFYSQGYRFDWQKKSLTRTGGLFLQVSPRPADVYINSKFSGKTHFLFGSIFIQNLLPRKYGIEVKKNGYHPWKKNLEVKEKEVTEVKNIILFPENPNFEILARNVSDFWFSPDGKKIALREKGDKYWSLSLYDLDTKLKSHLIYENQISPKKTELIGIDFSEDFKKIILKASIGEPPKIKYFSLEIENPSPVIAVADTPSPPSTSTIASSTLSGENFYIDKDGYLYGAKGAVKEKISDKPFPVKKNSVYDLLLYPELILLKENRNLYLFSPEMKSFEKIGEGVNDLKISPDRAKIAYWSDYEIWILQVKTKKQTFLVRFSDKIGNAYWLNSDYLAFDVGNKIKISEIDDRDRINIVDIYEAAKPEIFFNRLDKKLFFLSGSNFFTSERLLP